MLPYSFYQTGNCEDFPKLKALYEGHCVLDVVGMVGQRNYSGLHKNKEV